MRICIKYPIVAIATFAIAGLGFASDVDPFSEKSAPPRFVPAKTRAEVKAELAQARAQGNFIVGGDEVAYPYQTFKSNRSRADVRTEARQAARTHRPDLEYEIGG